MCAYYLFSLVFLLDQSRSTVYMERKTDNVSDIVLSKLTRTVNKRYRNKEINRAYKILSSIYHPDKHSSVSSGKEFDNSCKSGKSSEYVAVFLTMIPIFVQMECYINA